MGTGEIIVICFVSFWAVFATVALFISRKKGRRNGCSGCSGNCAECVKNGDFAFETCRKTKDEQKSSENNREK